MKKKLKRNKNSHEILKTSKSNSNVFHYKKDVEAVEKLNFFDYNKSEPSYNLYNLKSNPNKSPLMKIKTVDHINTNILDKLNSIENDPEEVINKYEKDLNQFNISLNKLKQSYPNNLDLLELEKYTGIKAPTRTEHIKLENNLTRQISSCEKEENELKNQKESLETELINIDKKIVDQQLNLEVFNGMDNESSNKIMMEKFVKKLEEEYDEVKRKKSNKDFREQLDLYIKKEEHKKRLKMREIDVDINNNKEKKKVLTQKLYIINEELKRIHKKKNIITMKLYNHYLSILSEGKDTRSDGLCWIIKEIFGLNKKVMMSCMPSFLDKLCIKYLFNMTHLNKEIADVEQKIKITKEEFKHLSVVNKEKNFLNNKNYLSQSKKDNNSNNYLDEKNEIMNDYLKNIRQTFCRPKNFSPNSFLKNNNSQFSIFSKKNILNINNNKIYYFKKKKSLSNLPFIMGDPNSLTESLNKEIAYINKLSKDETDEYIPNVLKVKDIAEMCKNSGYFMNADEVQKVKSYFELNKSLNNLRKKKETMKTNEMTRIFNEFQKNNYAQRFNIDKISVINALIGEDNINGELVKQAKREKQFIEESMKIKMHKKIMISGKSASVRNIFGGSQYFGIKTNSNLIGFENIKNNGDSYNKRFNSFGNNNL